MFFDPLTVHSPSPSSAMPSPALPSSEVAPRTAADAATAESTPAATSHGEVSDAAAAERLVALMSAMGIEEKVFRRLNMRRCAPVPAPAPADADDGADIDAFVLIDANDDDDADADIDEPADEAQAVRASVPVQALDMPASLAHLFPDYVASVASLARQGPQATAHSPLPATRNALGLTGVTPRIQGTIARRRRAARYARFMVTSPAALLRVSAPRRHAASASGRGTSRSAAGGEADPTTPQSMPALSARTAPSGDTHSTTAPDAASTAPAAGAAAPKTTYTSAFAAQISAAALRRAASPATPQGYAGRWPPAPKRARVPSPIERGRTLGPRRGALAGGGAGSAPNAQSAPSPAPASVPAAQPTAVPPVAIMSSAEARALAAAVTQLRTVVSQLGAGLVRATQANTRLETKTAALENDAQRMWAALNRVSEDNVSLRAAVRSLRCEARIAHAREENAVAAVTGAPLVRVPALHGPIPESLTPITSPAEIINLSPPELRAWVSYYLDHYVVGERPTLMAVLRHKLGVANWPTRPVPRHSASDDPVPVPVSLDMLRPPPAPKLTTRPLPPTPVAREDRPWADHAHLGIKYE